MGRFWASLLTADFCEQLPKCAAYCPNARVQLHPFSNLIGYRCKNKKGAMDLASTVTKLYNYMAADIPEELKRWHVTEEEIRTALEVLSQEHADLARVDRVENGDAVHCACVSGPQAGRTVLLYPGRKLPRAEEAEATALGQRPGDRFSCRLVGSQVTLEVKEALRLTPHPVDDGLACLAANAEMAAAHSVGVRGG